MTETFFNGKIALKLQQLLNNLCSYNSKTKTSIESKDKLAYKHYHLYSRNTITATKKALVVLVLLKITQIYIINPRSESSSLSLAYVSNEMTL